jgi:hypothetical protein
MHQSGATGWSTVRTASKNAKAPLQVGHLPRRVSCSKPFPFYNAMANRGLDKNNLRVCRPINNHYMILEK